MTTSARIETPDNKYSFTLLDDGRVNIVWEDDLREWPEILIPIRLLRLGLDMLDGEDRKKDELIRKLMEDLLDATRSEI